MPEHSSFQLAEKELEVFVPVASKTMQCKAMRESLEDCSESLRKHVKGWRFLKRKNPLGALDLGHLARVANLSALIVMPLRWPLPTQCSQEDRWRYASQARACAKLSGSASLHHRLSR